MLPKQYFRFETESGLLILRLQSREGRKVSVFVTITDQSTDGSIKQDLVAVLEVEPGDGKCDRPDYLSYGTLRSY